MGRVNYFCCRRRRRLFKEWHLSLHSLKTMMNDGEEPPMLFCSSLGILEICILVYTAQYAWVASLIFIFYFSLGVEGRFAPSKSLILKLT